jgi:hypothetical protein
MDMEIIAEVSLLEFIFYFIKNFGQKRPILDKCKKKPPSHFG